MSNATFGALVTAIVLMIFIIIYSVFMSPDHNIVIDGINDIYIVLNASRASLGM